MSSSNYSFTSGANTGLNFSSNNSNNNDDNDSQKSSIRMAGEVFSNQNDTSNSSNDSAGASTGSWWRNQYSDMVENSGNSNPNSSSNPDTTLNSKENSNKLASSQSSSKYTMAPPKSGEYYADTAEVKAAWNAEYDEDQYRYYQGKDGVSTGADAYHTDMAKYQAQMLTMGDNPHLQLVNSMMHPDWQDHNYNGTYGQINQNANYSTAPTGAAYGPGGKKEGIFGNHSGGSKTGPTKSIIKY